VKESALLIIDAIVNLLLGFALVFFPVDLVRLLDLPASESSFYPSILGAVLFGIGLALLVERFRNIFKMNGLGIGGAIAINICGAGVLVIWLLSNSLNTTLRGFVVLWIVALLVLGISVLELIYQFKCGRLSSKANLDPRK
jgi:riboflavin transporter FmnP